jgi:cytochrome c
MNHPRIASPITSLSAAHSSLPRTAGKIADKAAPRLARRGAVLACCVRLLAMLLLGIGAAATAGAEPSEKDAIALVEKGAAFMKTHGKEEMIKRVNAKDPDYLQGALYLTMRDLKGVILANPVNQAMIGKDLIDVPDADGKLFRREIVELAKKKGKGWVDYKFKNPVSGKIEAKTSYIQLVGDVTLEAGIYKK